MVRDIKLKFGKGRQSENGFLETDIFSGRKLVRSLGHSARSFLDGSHAEVIEQE